MEDASKKYTGIDRGNLTVGAIHMAMVFEGFASGVRERKGYQNHIKIETQLRP